jgi:hypothetical protein
MRDGGDYYEPTDAQAPLLSGSGQPKGDPLLERPRAYHECGHLVAGLALGLEVQQISLDGDQCTQNHTAA